MVTQFCKLTFHDGAIVTGKVHARYPEEEPSVEYHGPVDRLHRLFETASPPLLCVMFRNAARKAGAAFTSEIHGDYEAWAE